MAVPVAFAEGTITTLRREAKLAVAPDQAASLRPRLAAEVGPPTVSRIVSVYFDGRGWPLAARAAAAPHDAVKLRFKEYFPDLGGAGCGRVVLELKREANGVTRKERVWVPRDGLLAALREPAVPGLRAWMRECPFAPVVAVSYEREVYQGDETWRVTVDSAVEFFRIDPQLALSPRPLRRELLGESAGREERTIVELKSADGDLPAWLAECGAGQGYSKFAHAMRCVHGVGEAYAEVG